MTEHIQKALEGSEIEAILSQGIVIPPQPKILVEIESLTSRPRVNVKAIASLISKDPALLSSVFRIVNSPAMGLSRAVDSPQTAISLLGLPQITNLIKSISVRQALSGDSIGYLKFWERSEDIARFAALVAKKQVSVCNIFPDQAYMAGLFHDCGVPVLMQRFPDYGHTLHNNKWPKLEDEDRQYHTDHCVVGYLVGKHWKLPQFILRGIRFHHEILAVHNPARTVVALLQFSIHLYNVLLKNADDEEWSKNWKECIEELGISQDGLREFEEEIIEQFALEK